MVRKGVEMIEKRKHYKELVHLGEFKNKLVYYDLKAKKLYFQFQKEFLESTVRYTFPWCCSFFILSDF